MSSPPVPIIGIVGGVGSGKSTLASALSRYWQIEILNADTAGHKALELAEVRTQLRSLFGETIFDDNGAVVRARLAARVFGNQPEQIAARHQLESIVHPIIRERLQIDLSAARDSHRFDLIVLDAPIMLEAGWDSLCDAVIFVEVPLALRVQRVSHSRGWSAEELARREASQWPLDRKRAAADCVISNDGDLAAAARLLVDFLQQRFSSLKSPTQPAKTDSFSPQALST